MPISAFFFRRRWAGVSVRTISSLGRTVRAIRCPPALMRARLRRSASKRRPSWTVAPSWPACAERDGFVAVTLKNRKIPAGICIRQSERFSHATSLALDDGRKVSAKAIVIATGSRPSVPRPFDKLGDIVITNETVFELTSHVRLLHVGTSQFTRQTAGGNFCLQIGGDRPQGES
jgi:hypothetical protein